MVGSIRRRHIVMFIGVLALTTAGSGLLAVDARTWLDVVEPADDLVA